MAENYDPNATVDDGSCIIYGCTDELALDYNSDATIDDRSCQYFVGGCTNQNSISFDPEVIEDDGSCMSYKYIQNGGLITDKRKIGSELRQVIYMYNSFSTTASKYYWWFWD